MISTGIDGVSCVFKGPSILLRQGAIRHVTGQEDIVIPRLKAFPRVFLGLLKGKRNKISLVRYTQIYFYWVACRIWRELT